MSIEVKSKDSYTLVVTLEDEQQTHFTLTEEEAEELAHQLRGTVRVQRKGRGECVCIGLAHTNDCPEWVMPL